MSTNLTPKRAAELRLRQAQDEVQAPVKLYKLARVEAAEATSGFEAAQAVALAAVARSQKGVATRTEKQRAYVDGYAPQLIEPAIRLMGPLTGANLWAYHLRELTAYERAHEAEYCALPSGSAQRKASRELYKKHKEAFHAKFGEKY